MSRFILGDDLGNIKTLRYYSAHKEETKTRVATVYKHDPSHGPASVQQLASSSQTNGSIAVCNRLQLHWLVLLNQMIQAKLSAAFSNGSCFISTVNEDDVLEVLSEWKEPRSVGSKFVGIALTEECVTPAFLKVTINTVLQFSFHLYFQRNAAQISVHCRRTEGRVQNLRVSLRYSPQSIIRLETVWRYSNVCLWWRWSRPLSMEHWTCVWKPIYSSLILIFKPHQEEKAEWWLISRWNMASPQC